MYFIKDKWGKLRDYTKFGRNYISTVRVQNYIFYLYQIATHEIEVK